MTKRNTAKKNHPRPSAKGRWDTSETEFLENPFGSHYGATTDPSEYDRGTTGDFDETAPLQRRPADEFIEKKVKQALSRESALSGASFSVRVIEGTVILSGIVDEAFKRDLASDIARQAFGVSGVNNRISVLKSGSSR